MFTLPHPSTWWTNFCGYLSHDRNGPCPTRPWNFPSNYIPVPGTIYERRSFEFHDLFQDSTVSGGCYITQFSLAIFGPLCGCEPAIAWSHNVSGMILKSWMIRVCVLGPCSFQMGVSINGGNTQKWWVYFMENPIKMDD